MGVIRPFTALACLLLGGCGSVKQRLDPGGGTADGGADAPADVDARPREIQTAPALSPRGAFWTATGGAVFTLPAGQVGITAGAMQVTGPLAAPSGARLTVGLVGDDGD